MKCSNPECDAIFSILRPEAPCMCGAKPQQTPQRQMSRRRCLRRPQAAKNQKVQHREPPSSSIIPYPYKVDKVPVRHRDSIDSRFEALLIRLIRSSTDAQPSARDDPPTCTNEVVKQDEESVEITYGEMFEKKIANISMMDAEKLIITWSNLQIIANLTNDIFGKEVIEFVKLAEDREQYGHVESITRTKHNNFMSIKSRSHSPKLWNMKPNNHLREMHQIKQPYQRRNITSSKSQRHSRSK